MLEQVLRAQSRSTDDLRMAIKQLVAEKRKEYQLLEFKSILPGGSDEDKKEFVRDVTALANSRGGVLVFGIAERDDRADQITSVSLRGSASRLTHILESRIEPPLLAVTFIEVPIARDDGCLVLEILASPRSPHVAIEGGGRMSYWVRREQSKLSQGEAELERAYRDRWNRSAELTTREDVLANEASSFQTPAFWLSVICEANRESVFHPTIDLVDDVRRMSDHTGAWGAGGACYMPADIRVCFRGIEFATSWDGTKLKRHGRGRILDVGDFVRVFPLTVVSRDWAMASTLIEGTRVVSEQFLCERALTGLECFHRLAARLDITGPIRICAGISSSSKSLFMAERDERPSAQRWRSSIEVTSVRTARAEDLSVGPRLVATVKSLLDPLVTAYGWHECLPLRNDGAVVLAAVDLSRHNAIRRWAGDRVRVVE